MLIFQALEASNIGKFRSESITGRYIGMLAQIKFSLPYKRCKVLVKYNTDKSYYVQYLKDLETMSVEYCWCRANQALEIGTEVDGYLCPNNSLDSLPTLIVGECKSIIPSFI